MNAARRDYLQMGLGLGVLAMHPSLSLAATLTGNAQRDVDGGIVWRERALTGFGTTLWLRVAHANVDKAEMALDKSVQLLRQLESRMSLFDEHSQISRLNRSGELNNPAADLQQVFALSAKISAASSGAFDITMQPLWNLWTRARAESRLPTKRELSAVRGRVNWRALEVRPDRILLGRGMAVSLNGIAQGFAADALRAQLQAMGIQHAMLDTGETAVLGRAPDSAPWRFGIEDTHGQSLPKSAQPLRQPTQAVTVPDGYALATSSDAHTTFTEDRVHHHILDPRTGDSPGWWSSVSVMAKSAALADGLTKVFFMLPPPQVKQAAARWQVAVILQDKQGRWSRVNA